MDRSGDPATRGASHCARVDAPCLMGRTEPTGSVGPYQLDTRSETVDRLRKALLIEAHQRYRTTVDRDLEWHTALGQIHQSNTLSMICHGRRSLSYIAA